MSEAREAGISATLPGLRLQSPSLQPAEPPRAEIPKFTGKTCFVIMPYGKEGTPEREKFNKVYDLIEEVMKLLEIKVDRSDRNAQSAPIHQKMITDILDSDLAIVDITNTNPNVFYELGIRHTSRPSGTVLICADGTTPPFNIAGVRVIKYDLDRKADSMKALADTVIANLGSRVTDSLVHSLVPGLNLSRKSEVIKFREEHFASLRVSVGNKERSFKIGYITGDIIAIDMVDVWVNPESTRMEMARIHDDSVSAYIRYYGAKKDKLGNVKRDLVHEALSSHFPRKSKASIVEAGTVVVTGPGELARQNVREIFHIAAQHGEPCNGYQTIRGYVSCVTNALERMDQINECWYSLRWRIWPLTSIVFPLMGVRSRETEAMTVTEDLVRAACNYLTLWPESKIKSVYFLAYTKRDRELCDAVFERLGLQLETKKAVAANAAAGVRVAPTTF